MNVASKANQAQNLSPRKEHTYLGGNLSFAAAEAYKLLRTNVLFALPDEGKSRLVGVTSACLGEGKSTTALNLALMLAEAGESVLVVEADMRLPIIAKELNLKPAPGLSNLLAGLCTGDEAIQSSELHERLQILPSGDLPPNPSELLGSRQMGHSLEMLTQRYDFILLDLPPVTEVADALVISKLVDGMIMVVRQDYTSRRAISAAMSQLRFVQAHILGFVVTWHDVMEKGGRYGKYGKYGRYGRKGYKYYAESTVKNDGGP